MPRLPKDVAKKAANSESMDFSPLEPGTYDAVLRNVDATKEGPKGPYWSWEFEITGPKNEGRKAWVNTSLADAAVFKLKEVFTALGFTTDSDTDEMIGEPCKLVVSNRTIQSGARTGQIGDQVDRVMAPDGEGDSSDDKGDDVF